MVIHDPKLMGYFGTNLNISLEQMGTCVFLLHSNLVLVGHVAGTPSKRPKRGWSAPQSCEKRACSLQVLQLVKNFKRLGENFEPFLWHMKTPVAPGITDDR